MLIQELQEAIIKNQIDFLIGDKIIFTGEETYLENTYVKQIAKITKSKLIFADSFLEIKKSLTTNTMMDKNKVFVIRNNNEFIKNQDLFKNIIPANGKYLILIYDKLDKRSSFFKDNQDKIVNFEKMTENQLLKVIRKNHKFDGLSDENCYMLIDIVNKDYGRLLLELDKFKAMIICSDLWVEHGAPDLDSNELFEYCLDVDLFYREVNDTVFSLIDSILEKDKIKSYNLLKNAKYGEFDVFSLMGLLYSNYKNMLLLKCSDNININAFTKNKLKNLLRYYTTNQIINNLKLIQDTEQGIKTGKIESDIADEYLLAKLLN